MSGEDSTVLGITWNLKSQGISLLFVLDAAAPAQTKHPLTPTHKQRKNAHEHACAQSIVRIVLAAFLPAGDCMHMHTQAAT